MSTDRLIPAAQRIRDGLAALQPRIESGNVTWMADLEEIATWPVEDEFSRHDATMRIESLRHHAALFRGDLNAATRHLDLAHKAVEAQLPLVTDSARWHDHKWSVEFNQVQLYQYKGDFAAAGLLLDGLVKDADLTLEPERKKRLALTQRGALALYTADYRLASTCYEQALVLAQKARDVDTLRVGLVGLAQAQFYLGQYVGARLTSARARGVVGNDPEGLAQLDHLDGLIHLHLNKDDTKLREASFSPMDNIGAAHRQALSAWQAPALNVEGDHDAAITLAQERLYAATTRDARIEALHLYALVSQDASLALQDPTLHAHALEALHEAYTLQDPTSMYGMRTLVTWVDYVNQWHPTITLTSMTVLTSCLEALRQPLVELETIATQSSTPTERRDFAHHHARRAREVAFDIAFRIGDSDTLAELIDASAHRFMPPSPPQAVG